MKICTYFFQEVAVVYPGGNGRRKGQDRSPFVNVDTTTLEGIADAIEMGFAESNLAKTVVTPFIYEANDLFSLNAKGRLFTVFRHPVERAVSFFYYIQVAQWEPTYDPELKDWSIERYAMSDRVEDNWLTRRLSNDRHGELTDQHLVIAMEVIRRKMLVGLLSNIEATMERFERFFHWTYHVNPPNQEECRARLLSAGGGSNTFEFHAKDSGNILNEKHEVKEGDAVWNLFERHNQKDVQLYGYIQELFEQQEDLVKDLGLKCKS